jgi:heme A synthase
VRCAPVKLLQLLLLLLAAVMLVIMIDTLDYATGSTIACTVMHAAYASVYTLTVRAHATAAAPHCSRCIIS